MSTIISNAIWLAKRQIHEQWQAYLITAAYFALMGGAFAADESFTREFGHPILMLILIQPAISSRYMTWKQDNDVSRHQVYLRSLPLPMRTTILARLIGMLVAGIINIPIYFGWFWFAGNRDFSRPQFIGWLAFWTGIALIGAGFSLIQEFWLSMRHWIILNASVVVLIAVAMPLLLWRTDFRPVAQSISLAENHAGVMAVSSLVLGIMGVTASVLLAERLYRRREFVT